MKASVAWQLPWPDRFGVFWQTHWPRLGPWLAGVESRVLKDELADVRIDRPLFIAGLPRSGSTILLEILANVPGFAAHRYADFPLLWTPFWWNWLRQRLPNNAAERSERTHRDRILVNRESPEAFEEPLWQQGFPFLHRQPQSEVLTAAISNPAFETLLRDHIRKLLLARGAHRYVSKGNYSVARIGYQAKIFPDARFLLPFRSPLAQVASLLKQESLYASAPDTVLRHIGAIGHHEFGRQRCVMHLGDDRVFAQIRTDFASGKLAQAWLRAWVQVYAFLIEALSADPTLAQRVHWVDYECLCRQPQDTLRAICAHAELDETQAAPLIALWSSQLSLPDYYRVEPLADVDAGLIDQAEVLHCRLIAAAKS